jgi:hypothetical protein
MLPEISRKGGRFLPCPKRKNRATVDVSVCQQACRYARTCPVFKAWHRPSLFDVIRAAPDG